MAVNWPLSFSFSLFYISKYSWPVFLYYLFVLGQEYEMEMEREKK